MAVARIAKGVQKKIYLGNLDAKRDWGYAKDYVKCMWLMLQHKIPEDFVIATGIQHTVREFVERAFEVVNIPISWVGIGLNEKGINKLTNEIIVEVDQKYYRPTEVESLLGDPSKAKRELGWNPNETSFEEFVKLMVRNDLKV